MRKITAILLSLLLIASLTGCGQSESDNNKIKIISTIFPMYDFAKNIGGDKVDVSILLPPGGESHSFEPTPMDIVNISESDLFIYNGGHSDHWIEEMLKSLDKAPETFVNFDFVEEIEGDHDADEHVWTTPENAKAISFGICEALCQISPENEEYFRLNYESFAKDLENLDKEFSQVCKTAKRKTVVFGDKFPFRYFTDEYDLEWYSAYTDCSGEAEPSAHLVAEITDVVKEKKIPVVFHIEFSNKKVAESIAEAADVETAELHSCHTVTKQQLDENVTYIDLMQKNLDVLKDALN